MCLLAAGVSEKFVEDKQYNSNRITEEDSQGGHASPGFEMFAMTCPHLAWCCQKPGRQLRTDLSGG